jgi:hypothetical protein
MIEIGTLAFGFIANRHYGIVSIVNVGPPFSRIDLLLVVVHNGFRPPKPPAAWLLKRH